MASAYLSLMPMSPYGPWQISEVYTDQFNALELSRRGECCERLVLLAQHIGR
jgi:hypothetical protein